MTPSSALSGHNRVLPLLLILFFGSGCAALIYEVIWLQMLQLVVGLTTLSLGVLLGTFMGGMCLGSILLPKYVSRKHHPLMVYAILEIGIALFALVVLYGMPLLEALYTGIAGYGMFQSILLRAFVGGICLVPPTLMMGATLPAIARWVETTPRGVSWMGFFYGGNIVGAVVGCLVAGFYLLRVYDTATATYAAFVINLVVAGFAILISRFASYNQEQGTENTVPIAYIKGSRLVYFAIGLSGLGALGAEVIWTRLLSYMLGATVYTFSIILAVFLVGLGIGSTAGSHLAKDMERPRFALGICQFLLVIALAWTAYMISHSLPYWPIDPSIALTPWYVFQLDLARCAWAVLPTAVLWGASFPIALAAVATKDQDPGRLVGGVYAANTVGAILGSIIFSMIGIPSLGTVLSQQLLVAIAALAALTLFVPYLLPGAKPEGENGSSLKVRVGVLVLATVVLCGVVMSNISSVPWGAVAYGRFMATYGTRLADGLVSEYDVPDWEEVPQGGPDTYALYVGEGLNGSVAVTQLTSGIRHFHSAGKVQASTDPRDMRLQRLLGHISALGVKDPKDVLVVACGAGVTAGSFIPYPDVENITICDIEPLVPKVVTPMFSKENYGITDGIDKENPHVVNGKNVEVIYDDGRHFISTTDKKFDIITSDPIDPWVKGSAALNTVEYYEMCKAHLNPGGVMSLWIPLYESNEETIRSVIGTFFTVFPNGIIWSNDSYGQGYDAVLYGQVGDTEINVDSLQARLDRDDYAMVRQSLSDVGFQDAVGLLSTYAGQGSDLEDWMAYAQINTDRNLRLQYLAGMALNTYTATTILSGIFDFYRFPENIFSGSETQIESLKQAIIRSGRIPSSY